MPPPHSVSVIIPAYNAARTLPKTLAALAASSPAPREIIVVDDGSTDDTAHIAARDSVRVESMPINVGSAAAKNCGASKASGDILFFTDSDIVPPPDAIGILQNAFALHHCDGVIGLLDENIPAQNWASQFKNLWMNFTYARFQNAGRIGLFYTSVAAIRREWFEKLGGFDENYRGASIAEDTEFGQRAWGAGANIILEPALRVIHLKAYTVTGILREDFKRARALTIMRLRKRGAPFFTSVPLFYQLAVPTIYLTLLSIFIPLLFQNGLGLALPLIGLAIFYTLNLGLLNFLAQKRGLTFAIKSMLFLPLDVFVVGLGMLTAVFDFALGKRY